MCCVNECSASYDLTCVPNNRWNYQYSFKIKHVPISIANLLAFFKLRNTSVSGSSMLFEYVLSPIVDGIAKKNGPMDNHTILSYKLQTFHWNKDPVGQCFDIEHRFCYRLLEIDWRRNFVNPTVIGSRSRIGSGNLPTEGHQLMLSFLKTLWGHLGGQRKVNRRCLHWMKWEISSFLLEWLL